MFEVKIPPIGVLLYSGSDINQAGISVVVLPVSVLFKAHLIVQPMLDFCKECSVPFLAVVSGLATTTLSVMRSEPFLAGPVVRAMDLGAPNRMPTVGGRLAI